MSRARKSSFSAASAALAAVLSFGSAPARAVDWMGMAQMYGDNVVSTLGNELLQPRIGRPEADPAAPAPRAAWPGHISASTDLDRHVFSMAEIADMESADRERLRALIDGRRITVEGVVDLPRRGEGGFSLLRVPGDAGYRLWASWRRGAPEARQGEPLRLRGIAEMERRGAFNMREPEIRPAGPISAPAPPAASGEARAADPGALRFTPSPQVSEDLARLFAENLAPALAAGFGEAELLAVLRGGDLQRGFAQAAAPYGLSDRDMADVMTGHLLLLWQVVNDDPSEPPPEGVAAIRTNLREALAAAPWPPLLDDAQKQRFSETLVLGSMLIAARYIHGRQTGDASVLAMARRDARDLLSGYGGPDLERYDLDRTGFVER